VIIPFYFRLPTLNQQPAAKAMAASLWFTALAVSAAVPANAGVQAIGSLPFTSRAEMIKTIAYQGHSSGYYRL